MLGRIFSEGAFRTCYFLGSLPLSIFLNTAALAGDWGYEGVVSPAPASLQTLDRPAIQPGKPAVKNKAVSVLSHPVSETALQSKPSKSSAVRSLGSGARDTSDEVQKSAPKNAGAAPNAVSSSSPKPGLPEAGKQSDHIDSYLDKDKQSARCWLQLFQTCTRQRLDYQQQKLMEDYMLGRAKEGLKQSEELRSILKFWPRLINDLRDKPEMESHYADLFRALLRLHERCHSEKTHVLGSPYSSDGDLITDLLGLQRLAVQGDPPFTEDAVNAYADMAVFIYEQQHPGRTIDANDNRAVFAKVVVEKFNRAPNPADQRAMACFDLSWAKFKIIWFSSPEQSKRVLLEKLVNGGANSTLTAGKDQLLELVLSNWPWQTKP